MEENKKSGGGDVRAKPFRGTSSGRKPKMCFSAFSLSRPRWAASHPTHIPRRPKKKPLRREKVGYAEKKTAPIANCDASCVSRVVYPYLWILATTDPPRLIALISLSPSCASGFAFRLHGVFHDMPSPMALLLSHWVWRRGGGEKDGGG